MDQANLDGKRAAESRKPGLPPLSVFRCYGLSVLGVALALGVGWLLNRFQFGSVEMPLLLFAIAIAAWYGGLGAAVLAWALSCFVFDFFFVEPFYSFDIAPSETPYFVLFALFAALVTWFSTVRRRVERELRQARDDLEKRSAALAASNKELEAFAYSVSHDLRAPLRHMAGFTELLQKNAASLLNERSQRYVMMILESARRMGNLIDDLLSFSRIGRAEAHMMMVNLEQLVEEALIEVRQDTDGRDIVWKVGGLPACYGDRSMLRLALLNLISNAVK